MTIKINRNEAYIQKGKYFGAERKLKRGEVVFDHNKGLKNPVKLNISPDTFEKLKEHDE